MSSLVALDLRQRNVIRHRWSLVEGIDLPLGRNVKSDQLQTGWDDRIASWHAVVRWEQGRLNVKRRSDPSLPNSIFYNGQDQDEFAIVPGEGFVIGTTIFKLDPAAGEKSAADQPPSSRTQYFKMEHLTQLSADGAHLEVIHTLLSRFQDRQVSMEAFESEVVQTLKRVVPRADFAAILHVRESEPHVHCSDGDQGVCHRLVVDAIYKQVLIAHRWGDGNDSPYPVVTGATWAVCAPVVSSVETDGDYAVYLSGARAPVGGTKASRTLPEDQLSLVALVAELLQSMRTQSDLETCKKSMGEFFPKPIRDQMFSHDLSVVLRTDEVDAAILFCDLRGSSRFAEQEAGDLKTAWNRIEAALSVMTEAITNQYGTIGDFQGDAAMGFWGWPRQSETQAGHADDVQAACQAADMLRERFRQRSAQGPLAGFACGIGIAAGPVVAGMLGTSDQRKIGVFGPAVNLAARLESMTKIVGASILIDERAREALRQTGSNLFGRLRYLASIRPAGMDTGVRVYELLSPPSDSTLTIRQLRLFEYGRESFEQGRWGDARGALELLSKAGDGPSKFLLREMDRLKAPPNDWDSSIVLTSK
jgi:adenylate cyclase